MIRRLAAISAAIGGILIVVGVSLWSIPGGIVACGVLLVAAGASNL